MLAYAAGRQRIAERRSSPSTMLLIVGVHVAAVAVAMTVKMAIDETSQPTRTTISWVDPVEPPPPPPPTDDRTTKPRPTQSTLDQTRTLVVDRTPSDPVDLTTMPDDTLGDLAGSSTIPETLPYNPPILEPVRKGPRLATPDWALKPPYPTSKLDSQEEASLRLRLAIDERGRVTAVDPVGNVDRAFLAAARKHLIAKWRYQPATVDGRPIATSTEITLRFQLEG